MLKYKDYTPKHTRTQHSGWNNIFLLEILIPIAILLYADFNFNSYDQHLIEKLLNFIVFSVETQPGKTNMGLVLIWVYRFIHGLVPIFIVDKLNDNLDQFDDRIEKFNEILNKHLRTVLNNSKHFSKSQFDIIFELIKLRAVDATQLAKQIKDEKVAIDLYQRLGFVPRAICNIVRLNDLLIIVSKIASTIGMQAALIIDEIHSLITDKDLGKPIIRALNAIKQLIQCPIVGITATPAAVVFHSAINEYFQGIMCVKQADFYKNKGLEYRAWIDFFHIKISQFPLEFGNWNDDHKAEFKELLTQYLNRPHFDIITHKRRIQKMFAIIGPDKNDSQIKLTEWINAEFKENMPDGTYKYKFQTYILNQKKKITLIDFLNNSDDIRPIIIIGRHSLAQGLTFKPTNPKKLAICPGLSDLLIIHSKSKSSAHDESNIQKLRGNGWHQKDLPKLNIYLSENDRKATDISIRNNNLMKNALTGELFSPQRTMRDHLTANCSFYGDNKHKLTRPSVSPSLKDTTILSGEFNSLDKVANYVKNMPGVQFEVLESFKFNINFSDNGILGDCHDASIQALLRKHVANTIREKYPELVGDEPIDRIQGAYSESRENKLLLSKINPYIDNTVYWYVRVFVGAPQQSLSNLTAIIYKKYKPDDFEDGKYYIFEAPNGKFYFSQHCPSRDRCRVVTDFAIKKITTEDKKESENEAKEVEAEEDKEDIEDIDDDIEDDIEDDIAIEYVLTPVQIPDDSTTRLMIPVKSLPNLIKFV